MAELWIWGSFVYPNMTPRVSQDLKTPTRWGPEADWVAVSGRVEHFVALTSDGNPWGWGRNESGQLGLGDNRDRIHPVAIDVPEAFRQVEVGNRHSVALGASGTLWEWGMWGWGFVPESRPARVGARRNWVQVAAGGFHCLALNDAGEIWVWGDGKNGRLGLGPWDDQLTPTRLGQRTDWAHVAAGWTFSLGITTSGKLYTWGYNYKGQLGLGDRDGRDEPVRVEGDQRWASAVCGDSHVVALTTEPRRIS